MNMNWFRRLLLSYLPAFFGITMLLFFFFFQSLNDQNRREAAKANEFLSQQVLNYADSTLKSIDYKVVREILTDPVVAKFFSLKQNDVYSNMQALKVMDDLKLNYPMIDSVYFVRLNDQFVLGDAPNAMEEFPDKTFIKAYMDGKVTGKWTGVREFKAFPDTPGRKLAPARVVTLVRSAPYFGIKQGLFVVNINLNDLQNAINQMYNPDISFVRLIDHNGLNVLGTDHGTDEIEKKREVYSSFTSPYTGWKVESGLLNQGALAFTLHLYNIYTVLAVVSVVLGALWVVHVTRRNYRPIKQIVSLIQTSTPKELASARRSDSEFSFIQYTLQHLLEETEQFRKQHQKDMILHKKYLFQEIMEGSVSLKESDWEGELKKLDLDVKGRPAYVQVLELDGFKEFTEVYNQHDQTLLKFTLYIVLHETVQNHNASVWAEWTADNRLSAIIWEPEGAAPGTVRSSIVAAVRQWVEQYLSFTVTIGLSNDPADALDELRRSYEKAVCMLQYKAVHGANRIIGPEHAARPPQTEINEYFYTIYSLSQSLRLSGEDWQELLMQLFRQIRDSLCSRKEIESVIQFLQQHLEREFAELSKEYKQIWKSTQAQLAALLDRWETVDELESGCSGVFHAMYEQMHALKESYSSKAIIAEIRSYIVDNYANPDLSLDYLSDKFQMNPKHVSKLFKEEFGENFVDFLIGIRMNTAKRLLAETHKSMQEISLEVGYYNYNSFNRAFKNIVGLSPRDYRKQGSESA